MKQFKCILFVAYKNIKKVCGVFFLIFQSWQYQQNLCSKEKTATKCVIITRRITIKPAYGYIFNTDFSARWTEKYYECCLCTKL